MEQGIASKGARMMSTAEQVAALPWFHSIDLGGGVITPGLKSVHMLRGEASVAFRHSIAGMSVMDVGAWDGFFSFEAERRGASRVLATDHFCWTGGGWGKKSSFNLARKVLGSRVEDQDIDPMEIREAATGTFDCVLFLGVLYHMRHPLYVLDRVASVTRKMLIMETHLDMLDVNRPAAAFYPGSELGNDPTNWWGPNIPAVIGMLRTAGFQRIEHSSHPVCPDRGFFHAFKE